MVLMWWYRVGMKWLGLGAGRRELKELEKTTIDKRIFVNNAYKLLLLRHIKFPSHQISLQNPIGQLMQDRWEQIVKSARRNQTEW